MRLTQVRIGLVEPRPLPGVATGSPACWRGGVARVQMTIESAVGSPLATP